MTTDVLLVVVSLASFMLGCAIGATMMIIVYAEPGREREEVAP